MKYCKLILAESNVEKMYRSVAELVPHLVERCESNDLLVSHYWEIIEQPLTEHVVC